MSGENKAAVVSKQDIVEALKNPDNALYKDGSSTDVIYKKSYRRNERVITVSDEAMGELRRNGLVHVEHLDGEMHALIFTNKDRSKGISIGVPSHAHIRWGNKGQIKSITDISKDLPIKKAELGLELPEGIKLAEADATRIVVPALQVTAKPKQI